MHTSELINEINKYEIVVLPEGLSLGELELQLGAALNKLIQKDFERLVRLLYRIDISEKKLRQYLHHHPDEDAGLIIAGLIIERQLQKIKTRQQFNKKDKDIHEDEKW